MEGFEHIVNEAVNKAQQFISSNIVIGNADKKNKKGKSRCLGNKNNKNNKKESCS